MAPIEIERTYLGKRETIKTLNAGEKNIRHLSCNSIIESIGEELGGTVIIDSPDLKITAKLTSGGKIDFRRYDITIKATDQNKLPSHQKP